MNKIIIKKICGLVALIFLSVLYVQAISLNGNEAVNQLRKTGDYESLKFAFDPARNDLPDSKFSAEISPNISEIPGIIFTRIGSGSAVPYTSAIQADGRIIVAGYSVANSINVFTLVRYNPNGSLDTTFNGTGIVTTAVGSGSASLNSIVIQPDGKIVAAGTASNGTNDNFAVVRYNPNGSLDTTFNVTGIVITVVTNGNNARAYAISIQSDGKIIVAGEDETVFPNGGISALAAVVRYNSNGSLDTNFNATGRFLISVSGLIIVRVYSVAFQPDGKIVIGGNSFFARINTGGSLDTSFNGTGKITFLGTIINSVIVQPDMKIIGSGYINGGFTTVRMSANGTLDTTFNGTGRVTTNFGPFGGGGSSSSSALQTDGKIILAGAMSQGGYEFSTLVRYNSDGSLDTTFNGTGISTVDINRGGGKRPNSVKIQPDNKIIATGGSFGLSGDDEIFTTDRYNSNGSLDTTFNGVQSISRKPFDFDGDGKADISVFRPSNGAWYLDQSSAGFTGITFGFGTDKLVPADYDGDGKTDVAVYRNGVWYLNRSQLGFTGIQFGETNDVPVPADYDGDGKADLAVFRPSNGTWYLLQSTNGFTGIQFGQNGDRPVPADFDGDGKSDVAVYRSGAWYLNRSQLGFAGIQFGEANDKPVAADYDGDGKTDVAVFRPSNGFWYLLRSTAGFTGISFGLGTDSPTPADYDGDGKADVAVFRNGAWYLQRSSQGFTGVTFGTAGDKPVPNAFIP